MSPGNVYFLSIGMAVVGTVLIGGAIWFGFHVWGQAGRKSSHLPACEPKEVQPIEPHAPPLVQMVQKGFELQNAGQHREAISLFEAALGQGGDAAETLRILNLSAESYYRLGEYAQAQTKGLAALQIARAAGATAEAGSAHCILGEAALKLGEWGTAAEHFNEGVDHFSQAGNEKAARRALGRLTEVLGQAADPESAEFYRSLGSELRSRGSLLTVHDRALTQIGT
ncbi:tetratricopeptide repeat protein [Variovorax sp. YR216]|uniref:tetratricopeptide repeat protein n=1 Tax=Variovorax sp. YR216 TaxID=1882828 RepID=UPI00089AB946|nr:tetratricopeptide repeat protein [Variovorax sp. YR216]SEB08504.1 Tetratricopeptide repeat-containing protein [Variovorax sp. YR216]